MPWKSHLAATDEANRWTHAEAISALPVCFNGPALDEFKVAPQELMTQVPNYPAPTLPALFEHMDQAVGVFRNNRARQIEFGSLVRKDNETLLEFARRVRSMGSLVLPIEM